MSKKFTLTSKDNTASLSALPSRLTILGVDPGFGRMGWGVIEKHGNQRTLKCFGCVETTPPEARLLHIQQELKTIIANEKPHLVAVEKLFFAKNAKTALGVSEARGVILLIAQQHHLPILEPTPLEVKGILTGFGRATKKDVLRMTKHALGITSDITPDDAADAVAIALWASFQRIPLLWMKNPLAQKIK